jgi:hypothetical protein
MARRSRVRLGLDLLRVDQSALARGPVVSRYPSYACATTIARLELILDLDLLILYGQRTAIEISDVDSTDLPDSEHHRVDLLYGHAEDPTAARGAA